MSDCRKCADFEWCNEHEECGLFKPKKMTQMKARRLFDADATEGYLLDGKYWIDPLIAGIKTNADRIRSMTDEELAEEMSVRLSEDCLMCPVLEADCPAWDKTKNVECKDAMLDWLKQEAKSDGD